MKTILTILKWFSICAAVVVMGGVALNQILLLFFSYWITFRDLFLFAKHLILSIF